MTEIGKPYQASGNIDKLRMGIALLLIGLPIALFIGAIYSIVCLFNPFPILNCLLLAITVFFLIVLISAVQNISKSRSLIYNIIIAALVCVTAYHSQWIYHLAVISNHSYLLLLYSPIKSASILMDWLPNAVIYFNKLDNKYALSGLLLYLFYFIELFLFLLPTAFTHLPNIFCEHCQHYNFSFRFYSKEVNNCLKNLDRAPKGSYSFLNSLPIENTISPLLNASKLKEKLEYFQLIEFIFCHCMACKQNNYLTINILDYHKNPKTEKLTVKKITNKISNLAIDTKTSALFIENLANKQSHS